MFRFNCCCKGSNPAMLGALVIAAAVIAAPDSEKKAERVGDPYPLATCAVSGEPLGSMGDAIVEVYDGREVRFCCAMCTGKFEKDLEASFAKLDERIIASQLPDYPMTTCLVADEELHPVCEDDPTMKQLDVVFHNRLVRLCCQGCMHELEEHADEYMKKLDEAVIAQQRDAYPLDTCLMSGEPLEEGEIVEVVVGNRLVELCCNRCKRGFKKNPTEVLVKLDQAWAAKGGIPH